MRYYQIGFTDCPIGIIVTYYVNDKDKDKEIRSCFPGADELKFANCAPASARHIEASIYRN